MSTFEHDIQADSQPPARSQAMMGQPPHHSPFQDSPFVGREDELAAVLDRLGAADIRLVTIIGPGGVGKTRLAQQAAGALADSFADGAWLVALAPLARPELIASSIAEAMRFEFYGRDEPQAQLADFLREKQALLVLDTFEHLMEGGELVAELLAAAPGLKVLVTSRGKLGLAGESVVPLKGLRQPGEAGGELEQASAVRLFAAAARAAAPGWRLRPEDGPALRRICAAVDGLPLAVELAGALAERFSCAEIAGQLEQSLDLLQAAPEEAPGRHRSLRAVFEYSWSLLAEDERRLFRRLAIFPGGFRRDAAAQVAGASQTQLARLVDLSMLRRTPAALYELHVTLRQYAAEKLGSAAERAELQARHAAFYAAFLQQRASLLRGDNQKAALEQIADELENIRAAWAWAADHGAVEQLGQAMEPLYRFYEMRGWVREGQQSFARAVAGTRQLLGPAGGMVGGGEADLALARLLGYQGELAQRAGAYDTARAALEESVALSKRLGARGERAFALCILGDIDRIQGQYEPARRLLKESHALFQVLGNRPGMARALNNQGIVAGSQGQWPEARDFFQRAIAIYQEFGEQRGIAKALNNLGIIAYMDGDHEGASQLYGRSRAIYEELGDKIGMASSFNNLAIVAKELRRYGEARDLNRRSLRMFREIGYQLGAMQVLKDLGDVAAAEGAEAEARDYFLQGLRTALQAGVLPVALAMLVSLAPLLIAQGRRRAALAGLVLAAGHAAADGETRRRADQLLAEIAPAFDPALIERLRAEPPALEQVAAEIAA